jgi:hypothetical protein
VIGYSPTQVSSIRSMNQDETQRHCELQRGWNRAATAPGVMEVFASRDGSDPETDSKR